MHEKLPVTFVMMNNRAYNVPKNFTKTQPHRFSAQADRFIAMDLIDPVVDFLALVASMGMLARCVSQAVDIARAVEAGMASGTPNLIKLPISAGR